MKKESYLTKLRHKFIYQKKLFKVSYIESTKYKKKIKVFHLTTYKNFQEYVEGLINMDEYVAYLLKPLFSFRLTNNIISFDIVVLNQNLEILELHRDCKRGFELQMYLKPLAIMILGKNSINFFELNVGEKIKLSRFND